MRQVGSLPSESEANRFAAWLVTQHIDAHAEHENSTWVIWVRDEDHLAKAREALAHFQATPLDARYKNVESSAEAIRREEERKRQKARSNVVQMSNRWGVAGSTARRCPLVLSLIAASILVMLLSGNIAETNSRVERRVISPVESGLLFRDPRLPLTLEGTIDVFASIRLGEIWRLITPIFIHFGITHLIFNMLMLLGLGGQIENRRGTLFMLVLVLALAVLSNVGQAIDASVNNPSAFRFGGMSGVVYGVFGYVLIKMKFDRREPYPLSPITVWFAIGWFVLCIVRDYPPFDQMLGVIPQTANTAHAVGLFLGMAIAYAPLLVRGRAT